MKDFSSQFWNKVDIRSKDECWLWMGAKVRLGYGTFRKGWEAGISTLTHRISYYLHHKSLPKDKNVCHRCDNPPCCNPHHLFLGTQRDNLDDMRNKGRGSNPPPFKGKLSSEVVLSIYHDPRSQSVIAKTHGITQSQVSKIKCRRQYVNVTKGL